MTSSGTVTDLSHLAYHPAICIAHSLLTLGCHCCRGANVHLHSPNGLRASLHWLSSTQAQRGTCHALTCHGCHCRPVPGSDYGVALWPLLVHQPRLVGVSYLHVLYISWQGCTLQLLGRSTHGWVSASLPIPSSLLGAIVQVSKGF